MWVAVAGDRVVAFRTFMRWCFTSADGALVPAARAVDTATDPDYRGRGLFSRLTLGALTDLRADGAHFVFNTPNDQSRPGYLKMGWTVVARIPVAVMPTHLRSILAMRRSRVPASTTSIATRAGSDPATALADGASVEALLATQPPAAGLATPRTCDFMRWRYGFEPLRYRMTLLGSSPADGFAVFRLRRRGAAVEAVLCDVLAPGADPRAERELVRAVARTAVADYVLRVDRRLVSPGPLVRIPRVGPLLTIRSLDASPPPLPSSWSITAGDIELL